MNSRGFSLVEVLVAASVGVIVLMGIGTFYLTAVRFSNDSEDQAFLQRQGTLILEELGRQIRAASSLNIVDASTPPGTCRDAITDLAAGTNALVVQNRDESGNVRTLCFYRNTSNQLIRCEFAGGTCSSWNLLSGSPVLLTLRGLTQCEAARETCTAGVCSNPSYSCAMLLTPCAIAGGTCNPITNLCSNPSYSCAVAPAAAITFTLSDGRNTPLQFEGTLTMSRH